VAEPGIDDLFEQTLQGDYDDEAPWEVVRQLHRLGTREVFDYAAGWCRSADPTRRERGCDVVAQLGKIANHPTNNFPEDCYAAVSELVDRETVAGPLSSAILALGHIGDNRATPLIVRHKDHSDQTVRFAVACSAGCFPNQLDCVAALLSLAADEDEDVRDWATFGVGVLGDVDTEEVRSALLLRLKDSNEEVREEAMVGLAKRKDRRVLTALYAALELKGDFYRPREAASLMLGMESDREEWSATEYLAALHERFRDEEPCRR
jgi:HEAT repeat protein